MRVTLFDYGAGNIHSLAKALATASGAPAFVPPDFDGGEKTVMADQLAPLPPPPGADDGKTVVAGGEHAHAGRAHIV